MSLAALVTIVAIAMIVGVEVLLVRSALAARPGAAGHLAPSGTNPKLELLWALLPALLLLAVVAFSLHERGKQLSLPPVELLGGRQQHAFPPAADLAPPPDSRASEAGGAAPAE